MTALVPVQRLRGQALVLGGARIAAAAMSAIWLILAARALTLSEYGDLAQVVSLSVVLTAASDLGLSMILAHDAARDPGASRQVLKKVVSARLVLGLPACLAMALLYDAAASSPDVAVVGVISISMLATMVHQSFSVCLRGVGDVRPEAWNEVASRALVLGLGYAALQAGSGVLGAVAVYAIADVASAAALSSYGRRRLPRVDRPRTVELPVRRVSQLALIVVAMTVYSRADLWLMGALRDSVSVARYAAPYRLFEGALIAASAFAALVPPAVARSHGKELQHNVWRLVSGAVALTTTAAVIGIAIAEPLLRFLYGERYASTAPTLRILLVAGIPSAAVLVMAQATGLTRRGATLLAVVTALVVNVVGNLIVIPQYGTEGAAAMTLLTQVMLAVWLAVILAQASVSHDDDVDALEFSDELARTSGAEDR